MSYSTFPTLANKPDSSKHSETVIDPTVRTEMEGGYVVTRARFTRAPRKEWTIGYTYISDAEKQSIETFVASVRVGSAIFNWTNPADNVTYLVRFKEPPNYSYRGQGTYKRWDVSMKLEQA